MALPIEQWYNGGPPKAIICPECTKLIDWPIDNPVGPLCPECGGLISVVSPATNEQPKREPMLSDDHMNIMFASYGIGFAQYGNRVREYYENLITRGKLLTRETHNAVIQDAFDAAAEVDAAGGDAPHAPAFGLGPWIRMRFGFEKKP